MKFAKTSDFRAQFKGLKLRIHPGLSSNVRISERKISDRRYRSDSFLRLPEIIFQDHLEKIKYGGEFLPKMGQIPYDDFGRKIEKSIILKF